MTSEFKNIKKLPVDKVILEENIPALSDKWIKKRSFSKYIPIKLKKGRVDESFDFDDEWISETEKFNRDLEWILGLNYHKFWSHVVYDKEFLNPLLYFLQESLPFYVSLKNIFEDNETALRLYEKVCRNGIVIVCRLITNRESEIEFMSKEKQAEILYSNFIISIPMIFDLVTLLGSNNKTLLQKIIETLVKIEPKYLNDLKMGIKFIQSTFIKMREQLKVIETENRDLDEKYEDITLYLMNIASTLNLIIDTASNELKTFCSRDFHLEQSIASLYDNFIPILYNLAYSFDPDAWFLTYISYARIELINCYRNLINRGISAILNAGDKNRRKLADEILSILTECAGYKTFIIDYVQMYPIEMDLDIITQGGKNIDKIKLNFVSDAYKIDQAASKLSNGHHNNDIVDPLNGDEEFEGACALPVHQNEFSKASMTTQNVEEVLQIETSKILELFPHYGVGYIRRLLAYYNNNSEEVISKIVEGNLDSSFNDCGIDEPYIPKDIPDKVFLATGLERSNIYDGDKFDVMRNENFAGHVKKNGKFLTKKEPKTYHELLNDKSFMDNLKDRYQTYGLIAEGGDDDNEYDDEYDDSYDALADSEPKVHMRVHGRMKDLLPDDVDVSNSEDEEDETSESVDASKKNSNMDFCENPETIRARREKQFQHRMAKKHPQVQQIPQDTKSRDVVGAQKGQGQSNQVLRNRQNKTTNKSSRANHNRKAGSTFKQSRGMF